MTSTTSEIESRSPGARHAGLDARRDGPRRPLPVTSTCARCRVRGAEPRGFTLIELMVVVTILGLAMTTIVFRNEALLPQSRLKATAKVFGAAVEQMRIYALLNHRPLVFSYDIDRQGCEAYFPYLMDDEGVPKGPGKTPVQDLRRTNPNVQIREVRLADGETREDGVVEFPISALGHIGPHQVVLHNPEFPDTEVLTIRVRGLGTGYDIIEGSTEELEEITDASFR